MMITWTHTGLRLALLCLFWGILSCSNGDLSATSQQSMDAISGPFTDSNHVADSSLPNGDIGIVSVVDSNGAADGVLSDDTSATAVLDSIDAPPRAVCDYDGDGFQSEACGGTDCNDASPAVNPKADDVLKGHCIKSWKTEHVVSGIGSFLDMVIDPKGKRHIAYHSGESGLAYAHESGSSWVLKSLDTDESVGSNLSLSLDSKGFFHISYLDLKWTRLKYATNGTGNVALAVLDQGLVGWFSSLAVDKSGRVHVAYRDTKHGTTRYATCANNCQLSSTWTFEDVDDEGDAGKFATITVDKDGRPYVAYTVIDQNEFRVAHKKDGVWVVEIVATGGPSGWCMSSTVDDSGNVYLSYMDKVDGMLRFASRVDDIWRTEAIAPAAVDVFGGQSSSIQMDYFGRLHVAWTDDSGEGLKYAWCPVLCDGLCCDGWDSMIIDANAFVPQGVSVALDQQGRPNVAYVTGGGSQATLKIAVPLCAETPFDANCDGTDGNDSDGDGFASISSGGLDCNDSDAAINPGAIDIPDDTIDSNCNGQDGS